MFLCTVPDSCAIIKRSFNCVYLGHLSFCSHHPFNCLIFSWCDCDNGAVGLPFEFKVWEWNWYRTRRGWWSSYQVWRGATHPHWQIVPFIMTWHLSRMAWAFKLNIYVIKFLSLWAWHTLVFSEGAPIAPFNCAILISIVSQTCPSLASWYPIVLVSLNVQR